MPANKLSPVPPTVQPVAHERQLHELTILDEYSWIRDPEDPRLLAYLRAEREYYDRATDHLSDLQNELFVEVERRLIPTDDSVSWRRGDNFYRMRSVTGSEYGEFLQSRDRTQPGRVLLAEETLTDEPDGYVAVGVREVSPDGTVLAYSVDTDGDEVFTLRYRDIATGTDLPDTAPRSYYGGAWSKDSTTFYYTVHDELYRPYQAWRHKINTDRNEDVLIYEEPDARFDLMIRESTSGDMVFIESESRDTSEVRFVTSSEPAAAPSLIRERRTGIEYRVDHDPAGFFVIVTNDGAPEFHMVTAPVSTPAAWTVAIAERDNERLWRASVLRTHLVLELRRDGFPLLRLVDRVTGASIDVAAEIPAGQITRHEHVEYDAESIIVEVQSLIAPNAWYDVDLASGARTLIKALSVPTYDAAAYRTERRLAPAADGAGVPVTLAYRADTPLDGTAPCLMWGYGAYESCDDPLFDPMLASLLDRGYVFAQTHPRGGGENGRAWWLGGRLANKINTFTDHLAVANWLAGVAPDAVDGSGPDALVDGARIATRGLSAGGLLQAVCTTLAPTRWAAVVAEVPFVDVVGSMLDPTIPLTINEWDEWGDPRRLEDFTWMSAYSPYDNLPASPRPTMLVTAALHDPRVLVHEPTKYVARLRATAAPDDELLFRVEMGAGAHTGPAGRYAHYRYESEVLAFVVNALS